MYLLDTNTLIYFFKGMGRVAEHLLATAPAKLAVSTITLHEIDIGLQKSPQASARRKQLAALEAVVRVVAFGRAEAQAAAKVRAGLETAGHPIGPLDNLIAGCAVAMGATLVTHNTKEFGRIAGLHIEDWF